VAWMGGRSCASVPASSAVDFAAAAADASCGAEKEDPVETVIARLIDANAVTATIVERAKRAAAESHARADQVLLKLGLVEEAAVAEAWSAVLDLPIAAAADVPPQPVLPDVLSARFLRNAGVLPLAADETQVRLAVIDPLDRFTPCAIEARTGLRAVTAIITPSDFDAALARLYGEQQATGTAVADSASAEIVASDVTRLRDLATDAPAIRFVDFMIERAIESGASDIHLTTSRNGTRLRYRVDGVLQDADPHPAHLHAAIVSRIKVLAELDIAERRLPQDGRIRLGIRGREIDLRIATMPHLDGEGVVLRILDRTAVKLDLAALGFAPAIERELAQLVGEPHGIVLVTGPTGSGKTTTLYAALRRLVRPGINVLSVEDPVEYYLDGVAQIQVQRKIGLDFPAVLRSVLRQDPDVIMIGEIRDGETAAIANQAALTGHFVLATLHTNSAAAALPRLIDMGLEPYLLASTIRGVLSQRLVRTLCRFCCRPDEAMDAASRTYLERLAASAGSAFSPRDVRQAVGCARCNGTGFAGRIAIAELLTVDDEFRRAVLERADASRLERIARSRGVAPLMQAGLARVVAGETTPAELFRVLGERGDP
jgi:general secretion pathway protein E